MASDTQRIITLEGQVRKLLATVSAFQGQPADATLSVPHNDSWLFEDNVDATHPANLRYVISKNITRVVSARLSIHLAAFRTYNNFSASQTGLQSADHVHSGPSHSHTWHVGGGAGSFSLNWDGAGNVGNSGGAGAVGDVATAVAGTGSTSIQGSSHDHFHLISVSSTLGVTEGATATGVTLSFDGVLSSLGPYNADVIELDVRSLIQVTQGVYHTIAMQPSGLGRIEAHLRLGVYVSAAQVL